jgi:alkaline phosphatase D
MDPRSFFRHSLQTLLSVYAGIFGSCSAVAKPPSLVKRIAFGSCALQDRPQPIWDVISTAKPDLFLFIGDNIARA